MTELPLPENDFDRWHLPESHFVDIANMLMGREPWQKF